ncbi:MAG: hypothetical protein Q9186_007427 [Xanthomendoza sp. 1 TL-2023]
MANGTGDSTIFGPDLSLTPNQQSLLRTALASNSPNSSKSKGYPGLIAAPNGSGTAAHNGNLSHAQPVMDPQSHSLYNSPIQDLTHLGVDGFGVDDSPFIDGHDFEDGNFDWDNSEEQLFGDLPGGQDHDDGDIHDKRKNGDNDEDENGQNKRHEGNERNNKKPGRKPLNSSEPTTKRKAQNRAAQRAFRERKERHLKDLETKVDDLEKASEATNHENGRLRATVERLNTEVKEYRKRLSLNGGNYSPPTASVPQLNNTNNNDFHFAFPKFGDLPGSTFMNNGSLAKVGSPNKSPSRTSSGNITTFAGAGSSTSGNERSPINGVASPTNQNESPSLASSMGGTQASSAVLRGNGTEDLNGLFSPSILESASRNNSSDYMFPATSRPAASEPKQASTDSSASSNKQRASSSSMSPSVSSLSHGGMDSSCGTTPEPSSDSQDYRKPTEGTLNTINEESARKVPTEDFCDEWATACGNNIDTVPRGVSQADNGSVLPLTMMGTSSTDINGIDWMARQNGGQFDPVLFGDYRETQDEFLNNDFFSEAFLNQDFSTPFNMPEENAPGEPKKDLMQQVEEEKEGGHDVVFPAGPKHYLTCEKIWLAFRSGLWLLLTPFSRDRLQQSEMGQSGEVDMDSLCSQLKAKAKCSGGGAVVEQKHVDAILGTSSGEQTDFMKMFR